MAAAAPESRAWGGGVAPVSSVVVGSQGPVVAAPVPAGLVCPR